MKNVRGSFGLVLASALLGALGCGDPTSPGIQPEIVNAPDSFSYQVSAIQDYSATASYPWQNGGTQANVNQACSMTGGVATLVILDANGTQVYSRSLADNGTFTTSSGVAGTWTVRIVYQHTSATVNFRADKTT